MILLVAATQEELGPLPGQTLGVGPLTAATRMAHIIDQTRPDGVILLGTGSSYAGGPGIGSACKVGRVGFAEGVSAMGLGYTPHPPAPVFCDAHLVAHVALPEFDVLTVGAVTTDPLLAQRLADGWSVEHLEAYGAALACHEFNVPFAAVLGIASQAGPEAHTQWLTHRSEAQRAARDAIIAAQP